MEKYNVNISKKCFFKAGFYATMGYFAARIVVTAALKSVSKVLDKSIEAVESHIEKAGAESVDES